MQSKKVHFKLHKSHKRWMVVGVSALALIGGIMQAKPVHAAENSVGTVNYVTGWNTVVWQRNNDMHVTNKWLPTGSKWRTYGAIQSTDKQYFLNVGGNQWVGDKYFDLDDETSWQTLRSVVTVSGATGSGVPVWNSPYADRMQTNHALLENGSRWQTYIRAVVNGQTWYNLGGSQWIQGQYAKISREQSRGPKHYISGAPSLIDGGDSSVAVKTHYSVIAKDVYGNILQTNFFIANVGDRAYVNAPTIPGYDVLSPSSQSIVLGNDTNQNEVIFKYTPRYVPPTAPVTPQNTKVNIQALDSNNTLITVISVDTTVGSHFIYQAPAEITHDGKTYERIGSGEIDLPSVTGNEKPLVYYKLRKPAVDTTNVPVNAIGPDGQKIQLAEPFADEVIENDKLDGYVYTIPDGRKTITSTDGTKYQAKDQTVTITKTGTSYAINISYEKVTPATTNVPVNAIGPDGQKIQLAEPFADEVIENDKLDEYVYTVDRKIVIATDGTKYGVNLSDTTGYKVPIKENSGKYEIDVPYNTEYTVDITAIDQNGNYITDLGGTRTMNVGKPYTYAPNDANYMAYQLDSQGNLKKDAGTKSELRWRLNAGNFVTNTINISASDAVGSIHKSIQYHSLGHVTIQAQIPKLDTNGNPMLDSEGQPLYDYVTFYDEWLDTGVPSVSVTVPSEMEYGGRKFDTSQTTTNNFEGELGPLGVNTVIPYELKK